MRLLAVAQRLVNDKGPVIDKLGNERAGFKYRVSTCNRGLHGIPPAIYGNKAGDRAEYRDVYTCGSVFHCPVCSGKVASGRRDELGAMVAGWSACDGCAVFLATYTHSHGKSDLPLAEQLAAMQAAYKGLCNSKAYKKIMKAAGVGAVRALEVTHGDINGWHPHYHVLWFVRSDALPVLKRIRKLWVSELVRVGLSGIQPGQVGHERRAQLRHLMRHALDIRDGKFAAEYVAKFGVEPETTTGGRWGVGSEMTKGHLKAGERLNGRTPFALLRMYDEGTLWAGDLFREYALAFHGKRQLVPSPGLRQKIIDAVLVTHNLDMLQKARILAVLRREKKTDAELSASADKRCTEKILRFSFEHWRLVLMHQARADALDVALLGADALRAWLADLEGRPRPAFADYEASYWDDMAFIPPCENVLTPAGRYARAA